MTQSASSDDQSRPPLAGVRALSPHLAGELVRRFSHEHYAIVERVFVTAQKLDANIELDFEREAGVSFNPRTARIPLILMKEVEEKDCRILAASILACVPDKHFDGAAGEIDDPFVRDIAALSRKPAETLTGLARETRNAEPSCRIHCATFLDRARQAHRASPETKAVVRTQMLALAPAELALAHQTAPRFATLLEAWHARFLR